MLLDIGSYIGCKCGHQVSGVGCSHSNSISDMFGNGVGQQGKPFRAKMWQGFIGNIYIALDIPAPQSISLPVAAKRAYWNVFDNCFCTYYSLCLLLDIFTCG